MDLSNILLNPKAYKITLNNIILRRAGISIEKN